jgi:hypothetical protein
MTTRQINFYGYEKNTHKQIPYICRQEPIDYFCDGKYGYIHFDGYYYVENHGPPYLGEEALGQRRYNAWLPQTLRMFSQLFEKYPYKVDVVDNVTKSYYKEIESIQYIIKIYRKDIHENTDVVSEIDDGDGENMKICFFPTNRQTIYFRVLEIL